MFLIRITLFYIKHFKNQIVSYASSSFGTIMPTMQNSLQPLSLIVRLYFNLLSNNGEGILSSQWQKW